jgi:hypothetical protein
LKSTILDRPSRTEFQERDSVQKVAPGRTAFFIPAEVE